ncbi:MAG: hypothetical protein HN348_21105 [Proteobacteria bacterium]|nr:hypothetical protein [Pseudomonadota bacterium]
MIPIIFLLLALAACSPEPLPDCLNRDNVLAEKDGAKLSCEVAANATGVLTLLAGRSPKEVDHQRMTKILRDRWLEDPKTMDEWFGDVLVLKNELWGANGMEGAEKRGHLVWQAQAGKGPMSVADPDLGNIFSRTMSVWSSSDAEELALTEMDIEGWIFYSSLCREVQGAGPLNLSVSDRVVLYRDLRQHFDEGNRRQKVALLAMGPYWRHIRSRWQSASYEEQQGWIKKAPLPPPMTENSLGYAQALLKSDLASHTDILHTTLGPFAMRSPI